MHSQRLLALVLLVSLELACGKKSTEDPSISNRPAKESVQSGEKSAVALDLVERLARCEVDHGGMLVDLGSPSAQGLTANWSLSPDSGLVDSERDGETWSKVQSHSLGVRFTLDETQPVFVSMRARGGISRMVAASVDGKPLGTVALVRGQARVVATRATAFPVTPGGHTLELRFAGPSRLQTEPFAEVDWIRIGTFEDDSRTYVPPTMNQIIANVPLSGVPHHSIALRAPATVRCPTFIPAGARLRAAIGFEGQGEGEASVQVLREGEPPVTLHDLRVKGGDRAEWTPVDVALDAFAGKVVTLELRSKQGTTGGRLLFGDPAVYLAPRAAAAIPPARLAVVIVMAGLDRSKVANHEMYPVLGDLQRTATRFEAHRAPTSVTGGIVASLLTGLSPRAHGVEDGGARLSGALTTIGVAARDGSVQTAMFSGCPTSFEAFGFARGWDKYATYSPVEGAPAVAPLTDAARWTLEHMKGSDARALVVVHARGGHPPWDVTLSEVSKLPPPEYSGPMEPRRSGEVIAKARARHSRFRLSEGDRTRMWAIYDAALAGEDRALGQFVDGLKKANLWDQTLFIVTGDVSTSFEDRAPFRDGEDLAEDLLGVPLWVHFPNGALAGTRVTLPTSMPDLSLCVLDALRLPTPDGFEGVDLFATASGVALPGGRPLHATLGSRYSTRLGDFILSGTAGKPPTLCDKVSDPNCEIDRLERMPRVASLIFRATFDAEVAAQKRRRPREPATIDANTAAALLVWGNGQ